MGIYCVLYEGISSCIYKLLCNMFSTGFFIAVISLIIYYEFCIFFQYVTQWLPSHILEKSVLHRGYKALNTVAYLILSDTLYVLSWGTVVLLWICDAYSHSEAFEHSVPFALNALPKYISITHLYALSFGSDFTLPIYPF